MTDNVHCVSRRERFFGRGELRVVVMQLLAQNESHGYQLIKAIGALTGGYYAPSPGVLYPTLDNLLEQKLVAARQNSEDRRQFQITEAGQRWVAEHAEEYAQIESRLRAKLIGHELRRDPRMQQALEQLKLALDARINQQSPSDARLQQIIKLLNQTTDAILALP